MFEMMMLPGWALVNTGAAMLFWFGPWPKFPDVWSPRARAPAAAIHGLTQ